MEVEKRRGVPILQFMVSVAALLPILVKMVVYCVALQKRKGPAGVQSVSSLRRNSRESVAESSFRVFCGRKKGAERCVTEADRQGSHPL